LSATNGTIDDTGTLDAGTLTGSASAAANLTGSNSIGTLGNFSAAGLKLSDGIGLTVAGTVSGGPSLTIVDKGQLAITGAVNAGTVSFTEDGISIRGRVRGSEVSVTAAGGGIDEPGIINAGTLPGSAFPAATLTGTANRIGTLGNFAATDITLVDGTPLTVAGVITGAVRLTADSISIPGSITGTLVEFAATSVGIEETGTIRAG